MRLMDLFFHSPLHSARRISRGHPLARDLHQMRIISIPFSAQAVLPLRLPPRLALWSQQHQWQARSSTVGYSVGCAQAVSRQVRVRWCIRRASTLGALHEVPHLLLEKRLPRSLTSSFLRAREPASSDTESVRRRSGPRMQIRANDFCSPICYASSGFNRNRHCHSLVIFARCVQGTAQARS